MPDWKQELKARLARLNLSPERELEIIEELSQHLEEEYEQALDRGAREDQAHLEVLNELNLPSSLADELRRIERPAAEPPPVAPVMRRTSWFAEIGQDLRYAFRMLVKNPGFTLVALVALALGIGANTAIFSVVNAVLLRPLPFKDPEQLVMIWENAAHYGFPKNTPSPANFLDWQRQNTVFQGMAAMAPVSFNLTGTGEPERLDARRVSANLFDLLGMRPVLGRNFIAAEDKPGSHVVILSYGIWQRRFGSDREIIGRPLTLSGKSYTVVGVMAPGLRLPSYESGSVDQLWVPLAFTNEEAASRGNHYLEVIARMKPAVTLAQARSEMEAIAAHLAKTYPEENVRVGAVVNSLQQELVGEIKPALLLLLGAVAFVLLIACANVANLLLARGAVRRKEIALRLAIGASQSRLARQFLAESVLLALLGGGVGLLFAVEGMHLLKSFIPTTVTEAAAIAIDTRVLIFTFLVALLTGIIFGFVPVSQLSTIPVSDTLKEAGRDSSGGESSQRLRNILIIGEVAVSFVLLIGAGLLINSFVRLRNLDPGFSADHLLTMKVDLSEIKYPNRERRIGFFDEVLRRVRAIPGVKSVAVAGNLPLTYNGDSMPIGIEGVPDPPPDERRDVIYRAVGPGYFNTMGIALLRGRAFTDADNADSRYVVVIGEKTADYFWPGENPIGKRLKPGSSTSEAPWREVIGVVKDVRQNDFVAAPRMQMYFTYRQLRDLAPNALVVRTNVSPMSLAGQVRDAIWSVDKEQTVSDIDTMEHIVATAVARQRFSMLLLAVFAGVALLLAAVGIYGVMSYSVAQRTREIGIRIALGARRADILRMTIIQGLRLVLTGLVGGLIAAVFLTRVMQSLLFGVSATDPLTFLSISLVLVAVAFLASYLPALRATKVDPIVALRAQ